MAVEKPLTRLEQYEVISTVEIAAPIEKVWTNVVSFPELAPANRMVFQTWHCLSDSRTDYRLRHLRHPLLRLFHWLFYRTHHAVEPSAASDVWSFVSAQTHGRAEPLRKSSCPTP